MALSDAAFYTIIFSHRRATSNGLSGVCALSALVTNIVVIVGVVVLRHTVP